MNLRLLFGKKELEIIEKQRHNVPLTQSEKNRLSMIIKPKIEIVKTWQPPSLEKGSAITEKIEHACSAILATKYGKSIKRIFLFGSQIDGTARIDSDIDLAVDIDVKDYLHTSAWLQSVCPEGFDVSILESLPFKDDVIKNGRCIYQNSGENKSVRHISCRIKRGTRYTLTHRTSSRRTIF